MLSVCLLIPPPQQLLNAWTSLYEIWYVYSGTWAHLNGVLHKSLPSVSVTELSLLGEGSVKCNPSFVATLRLGNDVSSATNTHATIEEMLDACVFVSPFRC
jgi:hypothetical protein